MQTRGMSSQQLAERLGVSYQAVSKVLKGQSTAFSAYNNAHAARFLGVSGDWLATGEGQMINEACHLVLPEGADNLPSPWQKASPEAREVACFALAEPGAPLPPWADKDMRKDINNMLYAASHWLREEQHPKKIAA